MGYQQQMKEAEAAGKQALSDYESGKGLTSEDYSRAGHAAEGLVNQYEKTHGGYTGDNALNSTLKEFSNTKVGREIETKVAKQAIKSEAKNAVKEGDFGSITKLAENAINRN